MIIKLLSVLFVLMAASVSYSADNPPVYKDPTTGMEFVFIKGGCYQMGDTFGDGYEDEKPVHEVCVNDFYMSRYVVTQAQWRTLMDKNPPSMAICGDNCPVNRVSWIEAQNFIDKLRSKTSKNYRFPTEAEWEYAARSGGKQEKWAGISDKESPDGNPRYGSKQQPKVPNVGQKKPNGLGLYDMSGTIWQWVQDWYDKDFYAKSPKDNPQGPEIGQDRVRRGGSWSNSPQYTRTTIRLASSPATQGDATGFRVAMSPQ